MNCTASVLRSTSSIATQLAKRCSIKHCQQATITTSIRIQRVNIPLLNRSFFSSAKSLIDQVHVEVSKTKGSPMSEAASDEKEEPEKNYNKKVEHDHEEDSFDDEMEQEEMFVAPHITLGTDMVEWGGPRRGGRMPEPTRFGDWERKGRCTDF